jgi:ribosomal protein S18 acetylase RimI-like enzyme
VDASPTPAGELVTFVPMPAGEPPASDLLAAMVEEVSTLYGPIEGPGRPTASPAELTPPHGVCLVGLLDGEPVAVGAVKGLEPGVAEIKRMWVAPAGRSRGLARALLLALEDAARGLGFERVRLDTGPEQPHAKALYLSAGYTEIGDYNANPVASFWAEKHLGER